MPTEYEVEQHGDDWVVVHPTEPEIVCDSQPVATQIVEALSAAPATYRFTIEAVLGAEGQSKIVAIEEV